MEEGEVAQILARDYWVFDLDGTLTVPVHDFAAIRAALGIPDGVDILGHIDGLPPEEAKRLHGELDAIEEELAGRAEAAAGAVRLVKALRGRGNRLGIVTRNTKRIALRVLEAIGVGEHFAPEHVLGRHDVLPKPDPAGLARLGAGWGISGRAMVMVGDYLFDLQSGRAAGTATVHVDRTGAFRWPELADIAVSSLDELADRLPGAGPATPRIPGPWRIS
ncbi:HAD family hydrolase [Geobacter pickeringii]|uniref:HAD family hydrolase n=1 Tax=Geobacter pickeringii TaxID=345632 RepID=UPI00068EFE9B|nr:HAD-IA family hydrolase [Geobacter pickeringii]